MIYRLGAHAGNSLSSYSTDRHMHGSAARIVLCGACAIRYDLWPTKRDLNGHALLQVLAGLWSLPA